MGAAPSHCSAVQCSGWGIAEEDDDQFGGNEGQAEEGGDEQGYLPAQPPSNLVSSVRWDVGLIHCAPGIRWLRP